MAKRVYNRGANRHTEQYNSYVSEREFKQLEELRIKIARHKGISPESFSRGAFLMWMWRKCYTELDDGIPLEDFCDKQVSDLEELVKHIQGIISKTTAFKEDALKVVDNGETDDGQTETEQDN